MATKLDRVKSVIASVAPSLATALGGPLAGMAVGAISKAIAGTPEADPAQVAAQIASSNDPDLLLKLKQADNDFAEQMKKMDVDLESLNTQDKASARAMQIATKDVVPRNLAYTMVGFFSVYSVLSLFLMIHYGGRVSEAVLTPVATLAGGVLTYSIREVSSVFSFYFGSSSGSADKTEVLGDTLKTAVAAQTK